MDYVDEEMEIGVDVIEIGDLVKNINTGQIWRVFGIYDMPNFLGVSLEDGSENRILVNAWELVESFERITEAKDG